jgi:holliday junction DNA helicase RuvB
LLSLIQKSIAGLTDRLRLLEKVEHRRNSDLFEEIIGHKEIKKIITNAIFSEKPVHILLVGDPGSAKTMFLMEIYRLFKASLLVVGSNTTKAGLLNQLFETRPKFVLVDELERMNKPDQTSLLHLMETGIISERKINKTRHMQLISRVFASANSCERISKPLTSRFVVLGIPEYTFEEFKEIVILRLKKEGILEPFAAIIAERVWSNLGSRDVRDAVKIGRLSRSIQDVDYIVKMMKKIPPK